jgi:CRISPR-associated protein Cmr1
LLFGNAWLSHWENGHEVADHCKSVVRLRLGRWDQGGLESWQTLEQKTVFHPETQRTGYQVGPHAYLAYGPLDPRGGTKLSKPNAAIQAGESATLSLAYPEESATLIEQALWLMHCYGSVGGRSRNGWGSYELKHDNGTPPLLGKLPLRDWRACIDRDWPHAIGRDEKGPLIWQTTPHDDWQQLMRTLAIIKIGLRTQFRFTTGHSATSPEKRHWLSYPVTKHDVRSWKQNSLRLPNSLRFKVRRQGEKKLVGVIFHMPCLPPAAFNPNPHRSVIEATWKTVHDLLDELTRPVNKRGYGMIADATRRTALKPGLDAVTLNRIPE